MRWEMTTSTNGNEVYQLYKQDKKILTLSYNPFSGAARVQCDKEKRIFLIGKEGVRRPKTVLLNEYGVKIGELGIEDNESYIDVNGERFYYKMRNTPFTELILYKESMEKPFVNCSLSTKDGDAEINFIKDKSLNNAPHPGLLMALCWYMFLPVAKENVVEFAS